MNHFPPHAPHAGHSGAAQRAPAGLNRITRQATVHCLTDWAIGEGAGMVIGTALGWRNVATTGLAVVLAFVCGYTLTAWLLRRGFTRGAGRA